MSQDFQPIPVEGPLSEEEMDLFGEYRHLIPIVVCGERMEVPENNSVLRALQYLELKHQRVKLDWGRYCWNNTNGCCEMSYRERHDEAPRPARACLVQVKPRLEIVELPKGGRVCR
jgi:hypothetical protein